MAENPRYQSASAFRRALEDRLRNFQNNEKADIARLRKQIAFDRLLARLFDAPDPQWILKGGYALELRLGNIARATKDIDFSIPHINDATAEKVRELLNKEARKDKSDWFQYRIGMAGEEFEQAVYGGWRFPVEALLDGRIFAKFHLDVGVGDAIISAPEWQSGPDFLSFAGIPPAHVALIPLVQQFAEKIHAYSYPWEDRTNSRTRDLIDLVLLIDQTLPEKAIVAQAIQATFDRRKSHSVPVKLKEPPERWKETYQQMASDCGVSKKTMDEAFVLLENYWNEIFK